MTPRAALLLLALLVAVPSACLRLRAAGDIYAYRLTPWDTARSSASGRASVWGVTRVEAGMLRIDPKRQRGSRASVRPAIERPGH